MSSEMKSIYSAVSIDVPRIDPSTPGFLDALSAEIASIKREFQADLRREFSAGK